MTNTTTYSNPAAARYPAVRVSEDGSVTIFYPVYRQRWEIDGAGDDTVCERGRHWRSEWRAYDVAQDRMIAFATREAALAYVESAIAAARTPASKLARVDFAIAILPDSLTYWPKDL